MLPYKSSGCSQSGQRRTFGVGKLRLSRPEQRIVPVERPAACTEAVQTFHLPGKSAARTPLALAVLVGTAVPLADAISPQPEVEGRGCRPGHGQPLRHDVLEGEAGAA